MFQKIVVGYDGSEQAEDGLALARMLAGPLGSRLTLVEVMPYEPLLSEMSVPPPGTLSTVRQATRERLEKLARSLDAGAEALESSSPARGLHEAAERLEADLIVVGSCHRGPVGRVLAGSVGRRLLNGSPCGVAVAPHGYRETTEQTPSCIGLGYDTSPEAKAALDAAAELARHAGAALRLISVVSPLNYGYNEVFLVATDPELLSVRREQAERQLQEALEPLGPSPRAEGRLIDGDPVKVLVDEASKGIDLLFVGSRGYGRLRGVLLGSVSAEVIASAPCPVVVVPRGVDDPSAREHGMPGA